MPAQCTVISLASSTRVLTGDLHLPTVEASKNNCLFTMKMMAVRLVAFMIVFSLAHAAVWRAFLPDKPEEFADQEGCYIKEENRVIPFGNTTSPLGHCYTISCTAKLIHYASCGSVGTDDPKCYVTEIDLSSPYPQCCPTIKCDDNNLI